MSAEEQNADVTEMQEQGTPAGEGSSATPVEAKPNTPEITAPSGVEQPETVNEEIPPDVAAKFEEAATPQSVLEEPVPELPANAKAPTKKAFDRLTAQNRALREMIEKNGGVGAPTFNPSFAPTAQPQTTNQPPVAPTAQQQPAPTPAQADPMEQAIAAKTQDYWRFKAMYDSTPEDSPQRDQIASAANAALRDAESMKEQRIAMRATAMFQQQQQMMSRQQSLYGEVAEVNESLDPSLRFIDPSTGMVKPDSLSFQAMASKARAQFGATPQQLLQNPEMLAFYAKDVAWRLNGASNGKQLFTQKQIVAKQKQTAIRVGVESGGDAPSAPVSKATQQRAALEKAAKAGNMDAARKLLALDCG